MARDFRHAENAKEFDEKVVQVTRVTKVVAGGKRMAFRVLAVVGDRNGKVGIGIAKAREVSAAIRKAVDQAKKGMVSIVRVGGTIPHEIIGKLGASSVLLKPAPSGHGVIAGGAVRVVLELAGIKDVVAKSIGSSAAINTSKATLNALENLKTLEYEKKVRNVEHINVKFVQQGEASVTA
ncbi:MAG: 30S ribosomal protein S5 [Candidatus Margulisiibacteriota bacterium]|nr:30S ribosomal protein S5 [Candidatus Margulisiibacteriota bacterium]